MPHVARGDVLVFRPCSPQPRAGIRQAARRRATRMESVANAGNDFLPAESQAPRLKRLAVFCGASYGTQDAYSTGMRALGQEMVRRGIGLVYGGGNVGLMGIIAKEVADGLGEEHVMGVIPEALQPREISGTTVGEIHLVPDMHTRKALMAQHADGFIICPGGFGTLDEGAEMLTWHQLGIHKKPCGFLNLAGYYDGLQQFFDHAVQEGFVRQKSREIAVFDTEPAALIDKLEAFQSPTSLVQLLREGAIDKRLRG